MGCSGLLVAVLTALRVCCGEHSGVGACAGWAVRRWCGVGQERLRSSLAKKKPKAALVSATTGVKTRLSSR